MGRLTKEMCGRSVQFDCMGLKVLVRLRWVKKSGLFLLFGCLNCLWIFPVGTGGDLESRNEGFFWVMK